MHLRMEGKHGDGEWTRTGSAGHEQQSVHLIKAAQAVQAVAPLESEAGSDGWMRLQEHERIPKLLLLDEGDGLG